MADGVARRFRRSEAHRSGRRGRHRSLPRCGPQQQLRRSRSDQVDNQLLGLVGPQFQGTLGEIRKLVRAVQGLQCGGGALAHQSGRLALKMEGGREGGEHLVVHGASEVGEVGRLGARPLLLGLQPGRHLLRPAQAVHLVPQYQGEHDVDHVRGVREGGGEQ